MASVAMASSSSSKDTSFNAPHNRNPFLTEDVSDSEWKRIFNCADSQGKLSTSERQANRASGVTFKKTVDRILKTDHPGARFKTAPQASMAPPGATGIAPQSTANGGGPNLNPTSSTTNDNTMEIDDIDEESDDMDVDGDENGEEEQDDDEDEEDDEEDDGQLHCWCRTEDDGTPMACCDACNEWFHLRCMKWPDNMVLAGETTLEKFSDCLREFYCDACMASSPLDAKGKKVRRRVFFPKCKLEGCFRGVKDQAGKGRRKIQLPNGEFQNADFCTLAHATLDATKKLKAAPTVKDPLSKELTRHEVEQLLLTAIHEGIDVSKLGTCLPVYVDDDGNLEGVQIVPEMAKLMEVSKEKMKNLATKLDLNTAYFKLIKVVSTQCDLAKQGVKVRVQPCGYSTLLRMTLGDFATWKETPEGKAFMEAPQPLPGIKICQNPTQKAKSYDGCKKHDKWLKIAVEELKQKRKETEDEMKVIENRQSQIRDNILKRYGAKLADPPTVIAYDANGKGTPVVETPLPHQRNSPGATDSDKIPAADKSDFQLNLKDFAGLRISHGNDKRIAWIELPIV